MTVPEDIKAERRVVGMMLVNWRVATRAAELVEPAQFYMPAHGRLFVAALAMAEVHAGRSEAERLGCWLDDEGLALVASVLAPAPLWVVRDALDAVVCLNGIDGPCGRVRGAWERRRLMGACERVYRRLDEGAELNEVAELLA